MRGSDPLSIRERDGVRGAKEQHGIVDIPHPHSLSQGEREASQGALVARAT
jgi:hypothetical protein